MMKVKTKTAKEMVLVSEWLTRFGINYTIKGFTIQFSDIEYHHWLIIKSAVRLNTDSVIDHLEIE
jgi:hypothetical protein